MVINIVRLRYKLNIYQIIRQKTDLGILGLINRGNITNSSQTEEIRTFFPFIFFPLKIYRYHKLCLVH